MSTELYRRFRPKHLSQIVGQPEAVATLDSLLKKKRFPHAVMIQGPTGTGKTTIARILRRRLECGEHDYVVVNCPRVESPLEKVREVQQMAGMSPLGGPVRVFHFEEIQSLSRAGFAQQALLDMLEDMPDHVHFILTTSDPDKVHEAVRGRCTQVRLKALGTDELTEVMMDVMKERDNPSGDGDRNEGDRRITDKVYRHIAEAADGSARKALVLLNQVLDLKDEREQMAAVEKADAKKRSYELVKMLVFEPNAKWSKVAAIIEGIDDDPESVRMQMLGFARKMLLVDKAAARAYYVLQAFGAAWHYEGNAGLTRACYECFSNRD